MKNETQSGRNTSFYMSREQQLRAELADLARSGRQEDRSLRKAQANAEWSTVRSYPLLMLGALMALSAGLPAVCLSGGVGSYVAVWMLALGLIGAVVLLNRKHRAAYVAKKMADGMSRAEAERDYNTTYDGS
jgi:hypothetical protein